MPNLFKYTNRLSPSRDRCDVSTIYRVSHSGNAMPVESGATSRRCLASLAGKPAHIVLFEQWANILQQLLDKIKAHQIKEIGKIFLQQLEKEKQ